MPYVKHYINMKHLTDITLFPHFSSWIIRNCFLKKQAGGNVLGNLGSNYHSLINPMVMVNIFVFSSFRGALQQRTLREWNSRCLEARAGKDSRGTLR